MWPFDRVSAPFLRGLRGSASFVDLVWYLEGVQSGCEALHLSTSCHDWEFNLATVDTASNGICNAGWGISLEVGLSQRRKSERARAGSKQSSLILKKDTSGSSRANQRAASFLGHSHF